MDTDKNWRDAFRSGNEPVAPGAPRPDSDPSIQHEPHIQAAEFLPDKSEQTAGQELDPLGAPPTLDEQVEHTVWEEPGLSRGLTARPSNALTYASWLDQRQAETSRHTSWRTCLVIAIFSGPLAVLGTLIMQADGGSQLVMICLIGPLTEEVMKVAGLLWVTEKRPYLFRSTRQILTAACCSGLVFAAIENVIYLNAYISNPSTGLAIWRWTACVALHVGCCSLSALGLAVVWRRTMSLRNRPRIALAAPYLAAAVAVHAIYNSLAVLITAAGHFS